ncbi:hypothetical protein LAB17_002154 [Salmonella enterica subsp. enterica serovar Newport]|nr:hypothetical protein [Salmonella enterica subsp. enterica serovar Newport]EJO8623392.1 hypothetical protein [Salmonella enterica subsp. enterica serovar Newport]
MSIKDKVQRLIEFNQQCRIDELINLVNHIFDKFEESLNDDMWDTDIVNGKAYLQKTVADTDRVQFLEFGLTDDGAVIHALLHPCLDNVDAKAYKPCLANAFETRTDQYEYPVRLVLCFPSESNDNNMITFDTKELLAEYDPDKAREQTYCIADEFIKNHDALNRVSDPKKGFVRDYTCGPLRRLVVTQTPDGVNVLGILRDMAVIDNDDDGLRKTFDTRLANCAFKYDTTVTFTLCFHPAFPSWVTTVYKESKNK